jgi:putative SOS response-associated peptidase YedK
MCADNPARKACLERMPWGRHTVGTPPLDFGETFPGGTAPFLANILPTELLPGMFGLMPHWGDPAKLFRMTYNARSETVAEKPSYRSAWRNRQFALVPVESFYEPCYESGKPVRWRIQRADGEPFALAGIWERRMGDEGPARWSFSMLTVNADDHPLMRRFHKPGDEKRSVAVLDPEDYEGWLGARTEAEARSYLRLFEPELMVAEADPSPPRGAGKL